MIRSLRKTSVQVEMNHSFGADVINAENTEVELKDNSATIIVRLKPVGSNQKDDANRYDEDDSYELEGIIIRDKQVRKNLGTFLKAHKVNRDNISVKIVYKSTRFYPAEIVPIEDDSLLFNM